MRKQNNSNSFEYLPQIIDALNEFYRQDRMLLQNNRHTHEQTVSFRVAMYLAKALEHPQDPLYVDCEYHGDIHNPAKRKTFHGNQRVRPDIIFHNRDKDNRFCIEMKIHGMKNDYQKIHGFIDVYEFKEGYCIYNIGPNRITINAINSSTPAKGIKHIFKFNKDKRCLEEL